MAHDTERLSCKAFIEFLDDYLVGTQDPAVRAAFAAHIESCECCGCYLEHYKKTIDAAKRCCCNRRDPMPEVPEHLIDAILKARAQI